ncbi:class I SAM-dependent methyltransferase [Aeromicrobium sp. UC242_57]|uniref:class I SAM-dependent methyltransferase n=1 Tax=Aeromicrobium sp. UC242_57 TaxID=3374624 RepID=UPI0037BEF429
MARTHPSDRALVRHWADGLARPVLDAGCGPGQWTDFLASGGTPAHGLDLVPDFVARARQQYPSLRFDLGCSEALPDATGSLGGVLAWYSLIHHEPDAIGLPLTEFARVIQPGGGLLIGYFEGATVEKFDHAVTAAYRWPADGSPDSWPRRASRWSRRTPAPRRATVPTGRSSLAVRPDWPICNQSPSLR